MEVRKYRSEEHDEKVMDWFSAKATEPDSIERYRAVTEDILEEIDEVLGIEADFSVVIAETSVDEMTEEWEYVVGMSLTPGYHYVDENTLYIRTTDQYEKWESAMKRVIVHEEAHQEFFLYRGLGGTIYDHMLFEGHAQKSVEKVSEEKGYNWDIVESEVHIDIDRLKPELKKKRAWNEPQSEEVSTLFNPGGSKWENAEGYQVTYQVVSDIMERRELSVQDLLEIGDEEWWKEVDRSIESLY